MFRLQQATTVLCGVAVVGSGTVGLRERSHYLEGGRKGKNLRGVFSENVRDELGHENEAEICCERISVFMCVSFKEKGLISSN